VACTSSDQGSGERHSETLPDVALDATGGAADGLADATDRHADDTDGLATPDSGAGDGSHEDATDTDALGHPHDANQADAGHDTASPDAGDSQLADSSEAVDTHTRPDGTDTSPDGVIPGKQGNCPVDIPIVPAEKVEGTAPMMEDYCWPELNLDCVTANDCKILCPPPDFGWCFAASKAETHAQVPRLKASKPPNLLECKWSTGLTTDQTFCYPSEVKCIGCRCIGDSYVNQSEGDPCDHPSLYWQAPPWIYDALGSP
jgi:hypothetical protein